MAHGPLVVCVVVLTTMILDEKRKEDFIIPFNIYLYNVLTSSFIVSVCFTATVSKV